MALVVIGGHSRNIGKTSVVAGLIAALPEYRWTAMKITQYGHGICSRDGKPCNCACDEHSWSISEEKIGSSENDTSRFMLAGARQAWWVRTEQGRLAQAVPTIRRKLAQAAYAILESNSILGFIEPELYISVLDPGTADFKNSARKYLDRADAIVLHRHEGKSPLWNDVSLNQARPSFPVAPPQYVTAELAAFVKSKLGPPRFPQ